MSRSLLFFTYNRKVCFFSDSACLPKVKTINVIYLICISINPQQDAVHLESQVNVLADGLAVSLLHEPLPDPSEPHIRGLLTRLEVCLLKMGGAFDTFEP